MGKLYLTCGFPGSGKSTYLEREKQIVPHTVVVCPDEFRKEITGQAFYGPAEESVWSHVKITARILLKQGHSVWIDATNLTPENRAQWVQIAKELNVPIFCVWFDTPFEICSERNRNREDVVPEEVMEKMLASFVPPSEEEGLVIIGADGGVRPGG
jgi:predicted kinase